MSINELKARIKNYKNTMITQNSLEAPETKKWINIMEQQLKELEKINNLKKLIMKKIINIMLLIIINSTFIYSIYMFFWLLKKNNWDCIKELIPLTIIGWLAWITIVIYTNWILIKLIPKNKKPKK